jgi:hypothetical protein
MSSRTHRKALPLDHKGIHWGNGSRHESGTPWEPDEWKRFVAWALENGAQEYIKDQCVEWYEAGEDRRGHGKLHRENGPARVWADGYESWYLNGQLHREDWPALIRPDGHKEWRLNGKLHRENGPAVVFLDGSEEWWPERTVRS